MKNEEFDTALNDLIWQREKLNAGLISELERAQRIASAMHSLRKLNDSAQTVVMDVLARISPPESIPLSQPVRRVA